MAGLRPNALGRKVKDLISAALEVDYYKATLSEIARITTKRVTTFTQIDSPHAGESEAPAAEAYHL